jgi:choline dehydrogenase-like flavoprotein
MLSGIGDSHELAKNGIEVAHDLPGVGKSLQDHLSVALCWRQKEDLVGWSEYLSNQSTARTARTQFLADGTGPLGVYFQGLTMGFFKADEVLRAEEFESLEEDVQRHLKEETVPLWEMSCRGWSHSASASMLQY